jgi:hypothetical protein
MAPNHFGSHHYTLTTHIARLSGEFLWIIQSTFESWVGNFKCILFPVHANQFFVSRGPMFALLAGDLE